ncbi:cyclase family protein [Agathobaculum sp.]|uniref:cyclase family protein n=1 Tax=Agathobaculum sp. TaxID=2048138 RepID=UPI002A813542|nr:cyclase family protein [Agathobaculum sp.]MDY3618762.1 cyclase family protein [Agathobaculum sp.]
MPDLITSLRELLTQCEAVDLSPVLENDIPRWPTHPPLVIQPTVNWKHDGYYCQTVFMGEHTGAHVDAPAHQVSSMMESTIEVYPPDYLCAPAVTYPMHRLNAKPGQRITADQILRLEEEMGDAAGEGEIVLMDFHWFQYWTTSGDWKFYAKNEPGLAEDAVRLFAERRVRAVGSDTIACDTPVIAGEEMESYGHHVHWLPNHILIMEELQNLDKLPVRCYFIATPLKIKNGSGSPIRPFAFVPRN